MGRIDCDREPQVREKGISLSGSSWKENFLCQKIDSEKERREREEKPVVTGKAKMV